MPPVPTCSECGQALPEGTSEVLCPVCALRSVADGGAELEPEVCQADDVATAGTIGPGIQSPAPSLQSQQSPSSLAPRPSPLPRFFGDYQLLEEIARGGMGVVYRARQRSLNRIVALKMIVGGPLASAAAIQRFQAEAQTVASLQHPNIVAIHEIGEHEGQPFFTMDYVQGQNLAGLLRDGPLPARQAAEYVKVVAEAVDYAHQRGILHRDLKPSNVLIDPFDRPRITDFGLAKRLNTEYRSLVTDHSKGAGRSNQSSVISDQLSDLTVSGQVLGSPNFMAPEQAQGRQREIGPASDVYSMGAMLYHLVTGRPPFQAATLTDVLQQVVATEPAAPRLLNPSVPPDLETICLKCLEKEVQWRYPTAQELAEDLSRFLQGQPIRARPVSAAGKAWKWCRRQPVRAGLVGALALVFFLGLTGVLSQWRRAKAGELIARQNAYAADMKEVQRALADNDLGRALELLNRYRPVGKSEMDLRGWEWRYFWSRCQSDERFTLCRYSNAVSALAFSPDGKWLAARQQGGAVALWDAAAKRPVTNVPGAGYYKALAFSPRANLVAWGNKDASGAPVVGLWDMSAQKEVAQLPHSAAIVSAAFSPDAKEMAALAYDGTVRLWDIASRQVVRQIPTTKLDWGGSLNFEADSESTAANVPLRTAPVYSDHYGCVLFSPDGRVLAVGEAKARIRLQDRTTGQETVIQVEPPADGIAAMAFSPDSKLLAAACGVGDNAVRVWDLASGTELRSMTGHSRWVVGLAFSPDGKTLASASADQTIRLWDVAANAERRRFQGYARDVWAVAWSPDGQNLVTGGKDGSVRYWDAEAKPALTSPAVLPTLIWPWGLAFSANSKTLLTVTRPEGSVVRWDATSFQEVERLSWLGTNHAWSLDIFSWTRGARWRRRWGQWNRSASRAARSRAMI